MTRIQHILMARDGYTLKEAEDIESSFVKELSIMVARGASFDSACEYIMDELGLEPDYIEDLLYKL